MAVFKFASLLALFLVGHTVVASTVTAVLTPQGPRDPSKVHPVPTDGEVRTTEDGVQLVDAVGNVIHVATRTNTNVGPSPSGWVAYAEWIDESVPGSSPISLFSTTLTIPVAPETDHGQTIFLSTALLPPDGLEILQPVLQWGPSSAGGGSYWTVASWYLVGADVYHTAPVKVREGDKLEGTISLTSYSGNDYNYISQFKNIAGTTLSAINANNLTWAAETFATYNITEKSDYPSGGRAVFSQINVDTLAGPPSLSWQPVSDNDVGVIATVNIDGPSNGEITISY